MYSILVRTVPLRLLLVLYRTLLIYSGTIYSTKMSKRYEILVYLLARSLNFILFIFRHPSKFCLTVDEWNTYICVEQKKAYQTESCGPVGSTPLLY